MPFRGPLRTPVLSPARLLPTSPTPNIFILSLWFLPIHPHMPHTHLLPSEFSFAHMELRHKSVVRNTLNLELEKPWNLIFNRQVTLLEMWLWTSVLISPVAQSVRACTVWLSVEVCMMWSVNMLSITEPVCRLRVTALGLRWSLLSSSHPLSSMALTTLD